MSSPSIESNESNEETPQAEVIVRIPVSMLVGIQPSARDIRLLKIRLLEHTIEQIRNRTNEEEEEAELQSLLVSS
jgi:hypothetical protein